MYDICIVDDDDMLLRTLSRRLTQQHLNVVTLKGPVAEETLLNVAASCYLLDLRIAEQSGLNLLAPLRRHYPHSRIIMLTGFASIATAVQAIKLGADDYLTKPIDFTTLINVIAPTTHTVQEKTAPQSAVLLSPDQLEWEHIQRTLDQFAGNISQTAKALGMHRRTLQRKLIKRRPERRTSDDELTTPTQFKA